MHRAHETLLRHKDLQFDFPRLEVPKSPDWLEWVSRWLSDTWLAHALGKIADTLHLTWHTLWYLVGGTCLALLVYFVVRALWRLVDTGGRSVQDMRSAMEDWRPTPTQARALLADADKLAAEGRYAEAVHLLLLRSIQDIDQFRPRTVQRSYTAREIEQLDAMPMTVRAAFAGIMEVVEKSLFGGYEVTAADYERCRADYERFAFPDAWRSG